MRLVAATPQLIATNYTLAEVIKAAENTFTQPTPLIQAMLRHLRGGGVGGIADLSRDLQHCGVNCPACGAQLHLHNEEDN
jgi:hypothetical protein